MEVRKGDQEAKEVGKGGHGGWERRAWSQKKEGIETEEGGHGSKKRRAWR